MALYHCHRVGNVLLSAIMLTKRRKGSWGHDLATSSSSRWYWLGVSTGFLLVPLLLCAARAIAKPSPPRRLPPAPLDSETLSRARNATRGAGFGGGLGPTDAEWVNGLTTPSTSAGPSGPCNAWGTSCTASPAATPARATPPPDAPASSNSTPAGGRGCGIPTRPAGTLLLAFGFGALPTGDHGASKPDDCPYVAGSPECLEVVWPLEKMDDPPCLRCDYWAQYDPMLRQEDP